jgi:chloramphenicol O-acetyltransferase type A
LISTLSAPEKIAKSAYIHGMRYLDLARWSRRAHFEYFKTYDQPFFSITSPVDVTRWYESSRRPDGPAFSTLYHYAALRAVNEIECLRYRLDGDRVLVHDVVHGGTTVLLDGGSFTFCYFEFDEDLETFEEGMRASIDAARQGRSELDPQDARTDLVHFTTLPWVHFTGIIHPRKPVEGDSIPKIAFGKGVADSGKIVMPVSIDAHHALVDGLHVGQFFDRIEQLASSEF